jgi:hypothetical protein
MVTIIYHILYDYRTLHFTNTVPLCVSHDWREETAIVYPNSISRLISVMRKLCFLLCRNRSWMKFRLPQYRHAYNSHHSTMKFNKHILRLMNIRSENTQTRTTLPSFIYVCMSYHSHKSQFVVVMTVTSSSAVYAVRGVLQLALQYRLFPQAVFTEMEFVKISSWVSNGHETGT